MEKKATVQVVDKAPYHHPEANELVIKTKAVAINPADLFLQKLDMIKSYPGILGCDAAGIAEEVGPGVNDFKPGDRVIGTTSPHTGDAYKYAGFQEYTVLRLPQISKIPDGVGFTDAVVLPLGIVASSLSLFEATTLGLDMPPGKGGEGKTLLIWGASSSLGCCGVQLAVAAGYEVFGVASEKNHALVKSLGATQAFDHNDADVVEKVAAALAGKDCVGAFDAISKQYTLGPLCEILHKAGGRQLVAAIAPGAESLATNGVTITTNFSIMENAGSPEHIWRVFLEPALKEGKFSYSPPADVVGHGLESIQKAIDLLAEGVSAKKLVVEL